MSVVPPKFRKKFCTLYDAGMPLLDSDIASLDNGGNLRWSLLRVCSLFNPKLKGYFHTPFTKVFTSHFLSVHQECMYSSSSMLFVRNCLYAL